MGTEEKVIGDTGEEKEEKEPIIDGETGEVKESETGGEEAGGEAGKETGEEKGVNWEERYKDLQGQKDREVADAEKERDRLRNLVNPFSKNIKTADDGSLNFDFSETSPEGEKVPEKPTEEEWRDDPVGAADKDATYREHLRGKKDTAKANEEAGTQAEKDYTAGRIKGWKDAQDMYPGIKDPNSEHFKRAAALMKEDPSVTGSPNADLIVAKIAAAELGIKPVEKEASPGKEKDASYIIGPGGGSGGGKGSKGKLSEAEFAELDPDKQREYMAKDYEKKTGG